MRKFQSTPLGLLPTSRALGFVCAGDRVKVAAETIRVGDVAEVWFEGAVAESYPVQAGASDVVLIGSYTGELPTPMGLGEPSQ